jgi:hypothetical protein
MEKILNEFTINLEREGFSVYVKQVDRTENFEKNLSILNELIPLEFINLMQLSKPTEQIILTRSDKVEISIIKVEGLQWNYELCVFNDKKGKIINSLRNNPFPQMESFETKTEALNRAIELLLII